MSEGVEIREARASDAAPLQCYIQALFAERLPVLYVHEDAPTLEEEREWVRGHAETEGQVLLLAVCDDEIIGSLGFRAHVHPQRAHAGKFGMSVRADWRGRGVGGRLLDALIVWARVHAIERIELEVFSNNPVGAQLYASRDFIEEGRQRGAVSLGDERVDLISMALCL